MTLSGGIIKKVKLYLKKIFFQHTSSLTSRVTSQLIPGLDGDIVTQCYKVCIRVTL